MESKQRLFIAIALPEQIKACLTGFMPELKRELPFQKWVHPEDLHITLKFLGETEPERIESLQEAMIPLAAATGDFRLSLGHLGTFGPKRSPSILWAKIGGETDKLSLLQSEIEEAAARVGFLREERAFKPHLTLARRYQGSEGWQQERLNRLQIPDGVRTVWPAKGLVLYRSHLGRQPMYEPVMKAWFKR
ncbi:RNA 2',3'-cyclic phosphodiesterase [Paenibacillus sp. P25]|nr:RNA 2',3'-cyclic phosphodiesterase [Paenibacillus sp. P25]